LGFNPRHQGWGPDQWRSVAPTVADLQRHGFPVIARCMTCHLAMDVRLDAVSAAKGATYVLWGKAVPCRRRHCQGRMWFYCLPPKAGAEVEMF
jgi:hypothetical protein